MERKLPTRERLKELLKETDNKLKELGQDLYDNEYTNALSNFYDTMKKMFVKRKLRKPIRDSSTFEEFRWACTKSAKNNKGYKFYDKEMKNKFTEYRESYVKNFLELVEDDIRRNTDKGTDKKEL